MATVTKCGKYWRAQIRRLGFPPQHKSFDTHAEAEAWARAAESEMDRGIFVSRAEAERTTLAEALERYKTAISSRKAHRAKNRATGSCTARRWPRSASRRGEQARRADKQPPPEADI